MTTLAKPNSRCARVSDIYVHTPFCRRKCPYCDFYSVDKNATDPLRHRRYFEAVARELDLLERTGKTEIARPPATLYLGGGTPSLIEPENIQSIVRRLDVFPARMGELEFSVEVNPESATGERLIALRNLGATRFSVGAQSFSDDALRALGRMHNAREGRMAAERVRTLPALEGADLSIDLIFAIPGQTLGDWGNDLREAIALAPDHVSTYGLTFYDGTRLLEAREAGDVQPASEELEAEMVELAHGTLTQAGYLRYEISNYARPGHECRHNLAVWRGKDYLGLGASAHSRVCGRRWNNPPDVDAYCRTVETGRLPRRFGDEPPPGKLWRAERLMLSLRTREGADLNRWPQNERDALLGDHENLFARLVSEDLATYENGRLALTPRGWLVYDAIVERFF